MANEGNGAIIIGAGLGGLVAALALQRRGVPVRVFEKAGELGEVGAGISLAPNATRVLIALGLGPELKKIANSPKGMGRKDYATGVLRALDDSTGYQKKYGAPYYQLHRADLHALLVDAVRGHDRDAIALDHDFVSYVADDDGVAAHFVGGAVARGALLIGCDGLKSVLRGLMWGVDQPRYLGYVAYRGLTPTASLPPGYVTPDAASCHGPGTHFTRYLIRGGETVNYVGFARRDDWVDDGWSVPATVDEVLESFAGWNDELRLIVNNTEAGRCHKWGMFGRKPMPHWTQGRATLLGDAAHPMLPFLGQGVSMAIEDGIVLARAIAKHGITPAALVSYEAARRPRANDIVERSAARGEQVHRPSDSTDEMSVGLPPDIFSYDAVNVPLS
ncbi:MAG: FAD-dependent monooxygenase [Alphaproteobacteria bacterium]|nr:FAD-dependent monooxygenase [Alphaproteobacteria bacterium]